MIRLRHREGRPAPALPVFIAMILSAATAVAALAAPPVLRSAPAPLPMAGQKPQKPSIEILAPTESSVLPEGKVLVIGRSSSEGKRVDLSVDGSFQSKDTVDRGGFSGIVTLSPGNHTISVRCGSDEDTITVAAGGTPTYVRHPAVEKCSGCHSASDKSYKITGPKDRMCYRCHQRKDRRKEVHGPMGAGECTACHDGHGSSHKALTVAEPLALCVLCHDQKSSEKHMKNSKGKPCIQCHDPHASDKPYHQK